MGYIESECKSVEMKYSKLSAETLDLIAKPTRVDKRRKSLHLEVPDSRYSRSVPAYVTTVK